MSLEEFLGLIVAGLIVGFAGQFIYTVKALGKITADMDWVKRSLVARDDGMSHAEMVVRLEALERHVYYETKTRRSAFGSTTPDCSSDHSD